MRVVMLILLAMGCGARTQSAVDHKELPMAVYDACSDKAPGESCVVRVDEVEASGSCAPAARESRLMCHAGLF